MATLQQREDELNQLLKDKGWKGHITLGVIILVLAVIISSFLFTILRSLIELLFYIAGSGYILYGIYEYIEKKK